MDVPDYLRGVRPTQVSWRGRAISVQHIGRNVRREDRRREWLRTRDEYHRTEPGERPCGAARAVRFAAQQKLMDRLRAEHEEEWRHHKKCNREFWGKLGISFDFFEED